MIPRFWPGRLASLVLLALVTGPPVGTPTLPGAFASQMASPAASAVPEVFARGLVNPRGLAIAADGTIYVAEAGTGGDRLSEVGPGEVHVLGHTGRLSRIDPSGERTTIVDGLPSRVTAYHEEVGPSGLAFLDDRLYLLTASGGWEDDEDFQSALFLVRSAEGTLERVLDYSAYILGSPPSAIFNDPSRTVPRGMPFGLVARDDRLYSTDGNLEVVHAITPTGEVTRIAEYPLSDRALTGIAVGPDRALYVAMFAAGKVVRISPDGQITDAATKLRAPIAVAFDPAGRMYVLQYYSGTLVRAAPPGDPQTDVVANELPKPTAMAFGPDGMLYISIGGSVVGHSPPHEGQIVRLRLT
jgi:glucose/arabinose dehydrogenase